MIVWGTKFIRKPTGTECFHVLACPKSSIGLYYWPNKLSFTPKWKSKALYFINTWKNANFILWPHDLPSLCCLVRSFAKELLQDYWLTETLLLRIWMLSGSLPLLTRPHVTRVMKEETDSHITCSTYHFFALNWLVSLQNELTPTTTTDSYFSNSFNYLTSKYKFWKNGKCRMCFATMPPGCWWARVKL